MASPPPEVRTEFDGLRKTKETIHIKIIKEEIIQSAADRKMNRVHKKTNYNTKSSLAH